ncbi:hypothetical protein, partial [Kineococcus indalonis]|uniref:hypothetical protein n=1 Tax=Kineococcus indalonis TaxID=2696566 RepID=UPI00141370EB
FTIRDRDDWNAYENGFGLTRLDGSAKPALGALRETNTWLHTLQPEMDGKSPVAGTAATR